MEIHAYKIDDSRPAPMFKIIEKPNDFMKNSKNNLKDSELIKVKLSVYFSRQK